MSLLLVLLGIVLLYLGGELLVRNAIHLSTRFGLSAMVIGLTVVAFGTSSPELAATLVSNLDGLPEVAFGNVVGSNIANVGLILGVTALVYPLQAQRSFLRREWPLVVGIGLVPMPLLLGGVVGRLEGALLLALLVGYLGFLFTQDAEVPEEVEIEGTPAPLWRSLLGVGGGIVLLVFGARALVSGAVDIAQSFGVPERVIGLTLVALGTSLPELASSLVAALKHETEIILGNVVGSSVFNILAILGTTALVQPLVLFGAGLWIDLWVAVLLSALLAPLMLMRPRHRIGRRGGLILLAGYVAYIAFLFA